MKLLIVERTASAANAVGCGLMAEGIEVDVVHGPVDAEDRVASSDYDAILVDVASIGGEGFELCRRWRESGVTAPILFLAAADDVAARVRGLESGGDDYLVRPVACAEVSARIRALLRRPRVLGAPQELEVGDLRIDVARRRVRRGARTIALSTREYELLEYLARHAGNVVSRSALWKHVWKGGADPDSNVVDVYVRYLRNKLRRDPDLIRTVRGGGYVLEAPEATLASATG